MLDFIMGIIGTLLYPLFGIFFSIVDLMEGVFNAFAGVGHTFVVGEGPGGFFSGIIGAGNDGSANNTGIVYYFLQHNIVKNLLVSIMLLGLFLLIIFTAMAFIKNAYAAKQKTWQEIIGSALKGLANFIFIPVCCLLGVWLGNILLNAIDGATSYGGGSTMSRKMFAACAYNANIYRNSNGKVDGAVEKITKALTLYDLTEELDPPEEGQSKEYYATYVDKMYSIGSGIGGIGSQIPLYSHVSVGTFYNLYQINYLMLIIVGVFMISVLLSLAYAMVRRMFLILMMFVVSPALCAMYPLDDGNATNAYKKKFIEQVLSAYAAVAGMNIFLSLMPIIDTISITATSTTGYTSDLDIIVQILILVSGLYVVKEFIGIIAGWIGSEDALGKGENLKKQTTGAIGKTAKGAAGAFGKAMGAKKAGGSFMGSLAKQASGSMMGSAFGINPNDLKKSYKDGVKSSMDEKKEKVDEHNKIAKEKKNKAEFKEERDKKIDTLGGASFNNILDAKKKMGEAFNTNEIDKILNQKGLSDDVKQMIASEIAKVNNAAKMPKGEYAEGTDKYGKIATGEDILKGNTTRNNVAKKKGLLAAAEDGFASATENYDNISERIKNFKGNKNNEAFFNEDGEFEAKKFTPEEIKAQELKIETLRQSGASADDIQVAEKGLLNMSKHNADIEEYEELNKELEKYADAVASAAERVSAAARSVEEVVKPTQKQEFGDLADRISESINRNSGNDSELVSDLKTIISNISKDVTKGVGKALEDAAKRQKNKEEKK